MHAYICVLSFSPTFFSHRWQYITYTVLKLAFIIYIPELTLLSTHVASFSFFQLLMYFSRAGEKVVQEGWETRLEGKGGQECRAQVMSLLHWRLDGFQQ